MTRRELTARINAEVSTYLGFSTGLAGLSAYNKTGLEALERGLGRMIEIQAEARAIESKFSRNHIDYMCISGNKEPEYIQAEHLYAKAQEIWMMGGKATIDLDTRLNGDWSKF